MWYFLPTRKWLKYKKKVYYMIEIVIKIYFGNLGIGKLELLIKLSDQKNWIATDFVDTL